METDLYNVRRWLLEDFKARAASLVPPLLEANSTMGAFDLMEAVAVAEHPRPLSPERKAYLLDLYLVTRWEDRTASPVHEQYQVETRKQRSKRTDRRRTGLRSQTTTSR